MDIFGYTVCNLPQNCNCYSLVYNNFLLGRIKGTTKLSGVKVKNWLKKTEIFHLTFNFSGYPANFSGYMCARACVSPCESKFTI